MGQIKGALDNRILENWLCQLGLGLQSLCILTCVGSRVLATDSSLELIEGSVGR